ncbi:unnamed protein product, partial [Rotaria sordida]
MPTLFWERLQKHLSSSNFIDNSKLEKIMNKRKYSNFNLDTCDEPDSPWYTGSNTIKKQKRLTTSSMPLSTSNRKSSKLIDKTSSIENIDDDDDLIIPLKRTTRKKKPQIIVSSDSDSDETIIIDDDDDDEDKEQRKPIKKKVVHRPEIAENKLNIETKQAMKEQTERDKRIQIQQEHEELARLERIRKQK